MKGGNKETYHREVHGQGPEANGTNEANQIIEEWQYNSLQKKVQS